MNDIAQALGDLPVASMVPIGLGFLTGVLLWIAGQRIIVAAFATIGILLGGVAGWIVGEWVNLAVSPWVIALVGAGLLGCFAALATRIMVAAALAVVLGIAAPLVVLTAVQISNSFLDQEAQQPIEESEPSPDQPDEFTMWLEQAQEPQDQGASPPIPWRPLDAAPEVLTETLGLDQDTEQRLKRIDRVAQQIVQGLKQQWEGTPPKLRPTMIASALFGVLAGALLGALARAFSAAVVTAFGGSLVWLTCAWMLATRLSLPDGPWLPGTSASWLTLWMFASVIGLCIQWQWTSPPKRADKSAG
ncbi:MAG: hypothetical protein O7D97_07630 [Planctomycetota bacterium]|nr:hypothetical protein [Planctomycetota bacterium]